MLWRLISDHALHFRSWNDEFVVYNSLSGDTHLLGATAAHALLELRKAPSDAVALAASLAPLMQAEMNNELVFQIDQLLADLDKLALIERG